MKRQILASTVLISTIAFSVVLHADIRDINEVRKSRTDTTRVNVSHAVSTHLCDKGLDKKIAEQRVGKYLKYDEHANSLMVENIEKNFNELSHKDIISYVSNSVLFQKNVDLSSYSHIVELVHKSNKMTLDKLALVKVERVSNENKNIRLCKQS